MISPQCPVRVKNAHTDILSHFPAISVHSDARMNASQHLRNVREAGNDCANNSRNRRRRVNHARIYGRLSNLTRQLSVDDGMSAALSHSGWMYSAGRSSIPNIPIWLATAQESYLFPSCDTWDPRRLTPWRKWTTSTACWAPWRMTTAKGPCFCRWMTPPWTCLRSWKWSESLRSAGAPCQASAGSGSTASCSGWLSCFLSRLLTFWQGTRRASSSPRRRTTSASWSARDLSPSTCPW